MKEGIIKCEQAKRGALRGRKFRQVLALAASQGLIDSKVLEQAEINPIILAKDIMEDYIFIVDADTNTLYFYDENKGFYSDKTETLIKREIAKRLDENFRTRYFTEINEFILATAPLVTVNAQQPEILAVSNGLLNVFTKELKKPSPEQCVTSRLDVEYLPERACPEWLKFLEQVIPNSVQRLQVQELIGHCLVRKVLTETVLVLLGTGANGKSICLDVVKTLLGESNVSSHSIQKLCFDKFTTIEIRNKLANICADLPQKELIGTGIFKALVSGDMVQGYTKHVQKTVPFMPTCKYLFSANNTPPVATEEDCYAWYRRFVFADFTRTFTKKDSVPRQELLAKMTTPEELSGILNWALEGLARLKQNGEISERPTVEAIRLEYIRRSDSALAYFEHSVTITDDPSDYVLTDVWFRDYVTYCHYHHLRAKTQGEFTKSVKQHLPGAEKTRMRDDPESNPISAWRYVKFVPTVLDVSASKKRLFKTEKSLSEFPIQSNKVSEVDTTNTPDTESQYAEGEGHI
jgi:putative DNA primase/helicase